MCNSVIEVFREFQIQTVGQNNVSNFFFIINLSYDQCEINSV
jgi:hypothetical protein